MVSRLQKLSRSLYLPFFEEKKAQAFYWFKKEHQYPYGRILGTDVYIDPVVKNHFAKCAAEWRLLEYHFHYTDKVAIEPKLHWAITENYKIIKESAWIYYENKLKRPYRFQNRHFFGKGYCHSLLVSVHTGWNNYWHFYNDIIGQIAMAEATEQTKDLPVLIPEGLFQRSYFQDFLALSPALQKKQWIIQKKEAYITAPEAHFFCAPFAHKRNYDAALRYIGFTNDDNTSVGTDKIYLTRDTSRGRRLANEKELITVLRAYGFQIIDNDKLSINEQINIFKNAAVVIGIHGAAFTNIIYRKGLPLHVIELFPADFINPCYYWTSQQYGFHYSALAGTALQEKKGKQLVFDISLQKVDKLLQFSK